SASAIGNLSSTATGPMAKKRVKTKRTRRRVKGKARIRRKQKPKRRSTPGASWSSSSTWPPTPTKRRTSPRSSRRRCGNCAPGTTPWRGKRCRRKAAVRDRRTLHHRGSGEKEIEPFRGALQKREAPHASPKRRETTRRRYVSRRITGA